MYLLITLKNKGFVVKKATSFELCANEMKRNLKDVENFGNLTNVKIEKDFAFYQNSDDTYIAKIISLPDNEEKSYSGFLVCEFRDNSYYRSYVCETKARGEKLLYEFSNQIAGFERLLESGYAYRTKDFAYAESYYHGLTVLQSTSIEEMEEITNICTLVEQPKEQTLKRKIA